MDSPIEELESLTRALRASDASYLAEHIKIHDNSLYLRVDTGDNTVKENEAEYFDICEDLRLIGYNLVNECIEHDCITGTVVKSASISVCIAPITPAAYVADSIFASQPAQPTLSPARTYAWCESLMKGAKRCREAGDAGDAATLDEIASYFRNHPNAK